MGDPKPKKVKILYKIRDVVKQEYCDLIEAKILFEPTHKEYIGSYQRAVTTFIDNMKKKRFRGG